MNEIEIEKNIFLTAEGLAVFKTLKLAAAADLHIGFEESMGEQLARIQTKKILEKTMRVLNRFPVSEILLNGDIKYTFGKESKQEWNEIKHFIGEIIKKVRIKIVKGNHDFYLENMVRDFDVMMSKEFELNGFLFAHGDEEIKAEKKKLIIIGNEHPSIKLRDEIGAIKKYPCFLYAKKERVLVLPALNPWAPGTDVLSLNRKNFLSPILHTIDLENAQVYLLDGEEIYDFKKISDVRKLLHGSKR